MRIGYGVYQGFDPWREEIGRFLLRFSKCLEGLVIFHFISFLSWIQIVKVLGVIHANWLRPGALGILPNIFSSKVINRWNLLDQRTVDAPSINAFKCGLCYIKDNRMGFFMD